MSYRQGDVLDYALMQGFTLAVIAAIYPGLVTLMAAMMVACMVLRFVWRFGLPRRAPRLQLVALLAHSLQLKAANIPRALVLACVKHVLLSTVEPPATPLDVDGEWLFWLSFWLITTVRLVFFGHHLWRRRFVDSYLRQTTWKGTLEQVRRLATIACVTQLATTAHAGACVERHTCLCLQTSISVELVHALCTGIMTHLALVAPWYFLIANRQVHAALFPFHILIDRYVDRSFYGSELFDRWYYRDHWLGHHRECDFVYLHGPHHDAIPVSFMSSAETGMLEAPIRSILGHPDIYFHPFYACYFITRTTIEVMVGHQYVPGVWPYASTVVNMGIHHYEHHMRSLKPYSGAMTGQNDCKRPTLEERLNGYDPNNEMWAAFVQDVRSIEHY